VSAAPSPSFLARQDASPGGILSLDMAKRTGWCYGAQGMGRPVFHYWRLRDEVPGQAFASLENEVVACFERYRPRYLVYEASLPASGQKFAKTADFLIGTCAIMDAACYRYDVEPFKEYPQTVRAKVMGCGNGRITSKQKEAGVIVEWLKLHYGIDAGDHNTADAILQWLYAADQLWGAIPLKRRTGRDFVAL
jgi:hypothetical protein